MLSKMLLALLKLQVPCKPLSLLLQAGDFKTISAERSLCLLRAVNASIRLQAVQLKNRASDLRRKPASREAEEGLRLFARRDFHQCILDNSLVPNSRTLEVCL